jgi:hypothetical protein
MTVSSPDRASSLVADRPAGGIVQASVSAMSVVMIYEHRDHALKVTRVDDQQPIEPLGTNGPHESFCDAVRLRA